MRVLRNQSVILEYETGMVVINQETKGQTPNDSRNILIFKHVTKGTTLIMSTDIVVHHLREPLSDPVALEGCNLLAVHIDRRGGSFAGAGEADADVGLFTLAGAVDHAAHDRDLHGRHPWVTVAPTGHPAVQVALNVLGQLLKIGAGGAAATGTGGYHCLLYTSPSPRD